MSSRLRRGLWLQRSFGLLVLVGLLSCIQETGVETASVDGERPEVEGSILSARSTGESAPAAVLLLRFDNAGSTRVAVKAYRINWPGGRFEAEPPGLGVEARGHVERTARIDGRYGDVGALINRVAEARLEVLRVSTP